MLSLKIFHVQDSVQNFPVEELEEEGGREVDGMLLHERLEMVFSSFEEQLKAVLSSQDKLEHKLEALSKVQPAWAVEVQCALSSFVSHLIS